MTKNDVVWAVFMIDSQNKAHVVSTHATEDGAMSAADLLSQSVAAFPADDVDAAVQRYVDQITADE